MNTRHILICFFLVGIFGCNPSSENETDTPTPTENKTFEKLYDFAETTDKTFCNPDSIVGTDCGGGDIYFTKAGTVFYSFFCMGADTTTYHIGKYIMTDSTIDCTFSQRYSYFRGHDEPVFDDNGKEVIEKIDPNSGKIEPGKAWTIHLVKLKCDKFDYGFTDDEIKYSVRYSSNSERFFQDFKKVNALANM